MMDQLIDVLNVDYDQMMADHRHHATDHLPSPFRIF